MGWEIFDRKTTRTIDPTVTLTTLGRVALNRGATFILEKIAAEQVFMLWDSQSKKCAIKVTGKKTQGHISFTLARTAMALDSVQLLS